MSAQPPPPPPPPSDGGVSSSLISPGLTSSLHGSATTFGTPRGSGFGSAFQSPGITTYTSSSRTISTPSASGYNMSVLSTPGGASSMGGIGTPGTPLTARGDRRSKLVRERSRSSAAFASSSGMKSLRTPGNTNKGSSSASVRANKTPTVAVNSSVKEGLMKNISEEALDVEEAEEETAMSLSSPTLFTSFCYKGMEVIFTAINHSSSLSEEDGVGCHLLGVHARTRASFQTCLVPNLLNTNSTKKEDTKTNKPDARSIEIVALTSHPSTGYIYASDNIGHIYSFYPTRADPMKEAYGKYRWVLGSVAKCREVFGYTPLLASSSSTGITTTNAITMEVPTLSIASSEEGVEVGNDTFSIDGHMAPLSIAKSDNNDGQANEPHGDKICFYRRKQKQQLGGANGAAAASPRNMQSNYPLSTDGQPPLPGDSNNSNDVVNGADCGVIICASMSEQRVLIVHKDQLAVFDFSMPPLPPHDEKFSSSRPSTEAQLLWTHKLPNTCIDHASISGDGCAIAIALRGEGMGVPYPFGVRTFVRDLDDGSSTAAAVPVPSNKDDAIGGTEAKQTIAGPNSSSGSGKPPMPKSSQHRRTGSGVPSLPAYQSPPLPGQKKEEKQQHNFDGMLEIVFGSDTNAATPATPTSSNGADATPTQPTTHTAKLQSQHQGILYKPAQFLVHSAPVTRLAFRGYGTLTSCAEHNSDSTNGNEVEGNDLLLTTCSYDNSVRIFSQNSWRQLMHWNSPPKSRADWVRGISAANLGDLDSSPGGNDDKRKKKKAGRSDDGQLTPIPKDIDTSGHTSSSQLDTDTVSSDASGGINRALLATKHHHHATTTPKSGFPTSSVPGTHAGAWIAELTFRNAFPALRLSRLSYMKTSGDDALPAHFESVAAILPPGSLMEDLVLEEDGEFQMDVEGIWPAWDPWEPDLKGGGKGGAVGAADATARDGATPTNSGSSNPLGSSTLSNATPTANNNMEPRWLGDGLSDLGGSHLPPSELRITSSSHTSLYDCVTQIEMPLWGDKDFGAMEFGAPMRYVMMMPSSHKTNKMLDLPSANLEYESGSRLCATSSADGRSIDLYWRKHGAVNLEEITDNVFGRTRLPPSGMQLRRFQDLSITPLPLSLPSLSLPKSSHHNGSASAELKSISSLHWWPDENYGGPPRLVALTKSGTIIVFEMPPPWSALEPPMPSYDPFDEEAESRGSSLDADSDFGVSDDEGSLPMIDGVGIVSMGSLGSRGRTSNYEICIEPHPDFGLGLRLEAQAEGMPAIAGSFKKHPLSGGRLPAERSGVIALGDELLAVNDVSLEGMKFEDAIATVRQIGFDSCGAPLQMHFRRCPRGKKKNGSLLSSLASNKSGSGSGGRRNSSTLGDTTSKDVVGSPSGESRGGTGSLATVEVGADAEIQQGFGRIIAIVRDAIIDTASSVATSLATSPAMLLLPWNFGKGATVSHKMYGGALILWAVPGKRTIKAARLEAVLDIDPDNARFMEMGSIDLDENDKSTSNESMVKSISFISSTNGGWLVAVHDCAGNVSLLFIETTSASCDDSPSSVVITASFRHYHSVFNSCGATTSGSNKHDPRDTFILRPHSLELFGGLKKCSTELAIWSALPLSMSGTAEEALEYSCSTISISEIDRLPEDDVILDFKWVSSGFVDAFPWLAVFTSSLAVVYHRSASQAKWLPIAIFSYKARISSSTNDAPQDMFPHLITALRYATLSNDEDMRRMKSDWHPESILASICTEEEGAKLALNSYVQGLYNWLSQWMNPDESLRPSWDGHGPLSNAPFRIVNDKTLLSSENEESADRPGETSASLITSMSPNPSTGAQKEQSKEERLLADLQSALRSAGDSDEEPKQTGATYRSREFMLAMPSGSRKPQKEIESKPLPAPLQQLNGDELSCIWAIGDLLSKPPPFKNLDTLSQLLLFCASLMRRLLDRETKTPKAIETVSSMPDYEGGRPMLMSQSSSITFGQKKAEFDCVASAAILSALMSDNQSKLLDYCRPKGEKFSWESARSIGIPYWVRSEKTLASIAEECAQTVYKSSKSVMDCALYYIATRNMKKLRAIAATDRSIQGKKFLNFIMDIDFSSERGRNTVMKNAYSLLRKRKYFSAASFFLLAEPPMIKTALDVIKSQLQDPSLAFFVARLVENAPKSSASSGSSLTIGGGFNLGSMGGGGGFAGSGSIGDSSTEVHEETIKFDSWKPKLGKSARSVLLPKDAKKDICFESLQLIWLGRPNEAKLRLSHLPGDAKDIDAMDDVPFPPVFSTSEPTDTSENTRVLKKVNEIINFCSGPSLLKRMKPKKRVLWSSALLVSKALSGCGIEIPSMRILSNFADPEYEEVDSIESCDAHKGSTQNSAAQPSNTASSIFDSFDAAPPKPKPAAPKPPPSDPMSSSSIFDSFDVPPPKPKPAAPSDPTSSSIFDSFDAAPPKTKQAAPKPAPSADPTSSSIFDSFDVAPPKTKQAAPKPAPPVDPMSSSIFDSFDAAPPKPKQAAPKPAPPVDPMSSSIFDSFDAAPPKPKQAAPKPAPSDPMSSSIFDSFDAAPAKPKQAAPKPAPPVGSIFDSFDTAPQKQPQKSSGRPSSKTPASSTDEIEKEQPFHITNCPELWNEWRERLMSAIAARRFLRELARIISSFDGEPNIVAMEDFAQRSHPIIPLGAAEVLHNACDSVGLLNSILKSLSELSVSFGIDETVMLEQALDLLSTTRQPRRVVFAVILQCLLGRGDLAEDLVRNTASFEMNSCEFLGFSNDTIIDAKETRYYASSLWARRNSSSVIWQLELCLWLNRGSALELSSKAAKETLLAVRVGLATAAWGRCHHSLDTMIKAEPDCLVDFDAGKNLWRSMKIIVANEATIDGIDGVTSGGWEFLVDCRREEATEMLRDGKTGQFLIRPHPQDPGVFTLSFKTNLVPTEPTPSTNYDEAGTMDKPQEAASSSANAQKVIKRDDVVQHAIVRLSDSGFRCGSFGPFATLVKLLHAVSDSLPFELRFSDPPIKGIISEKGTQTSPNSFLFRKMTLHSKAQLYQFQSSRNMEITAVDDCFDRDPEDDDDEANLHRRFGLFSQLMFLTEFRKQLCAVAAAVEDEPDARNEKDHRFPEVGIDDDFDGSISEGSLEPDHEEAHGVASRMVKPLLNWVQAREIDLVNEVAPCISRNKQKPSTVSLLDAMKALGEEFEEPPSIAGGDSMIRRMIQAGSGVDFRTLRVGETGNSVIVVLFGKQDAIKWIMANETGDDEEDATRRLKAMELLRIIEPITSCDLSIPKSYAASHPSTESRYRFVDPWEVEALESRSGETASAALGRGRYQSLSIGLIASSCEKVVRAAGGLHLLELWSTLKGGITLTKALCSAHPSWERDAGGDLLMKKGFLMEPSPYDNSIRQHLYGNYLFRRLGMPQRFLALVQVELLDLKNVTSPSGSSSLTAYALLRLKRQGSSAPLNHKARSLDSACTQARKIAKSSGPNAPASWGSLVRFRFTLPEDVNCEGRSFDADRERLFKGPPTCLQITAYEKKFMSDVELGGADVNLESLGSGGQIEEWVPLRAGKDGITWFARIRLSLRFELLCLDSSFDLTANETSQDDVRCPSVGLKKIQKLSRLGAHEDPKQGVKNSLSTPDLVGYFGNMLL